MSMDMSQDMNLDQSPERCQFFNDACHSVELAQQYAQKAKASFSPTDWQTAQGFLQQAYTQWDYTQKNYHQLTAEQWEKFENTQQALEAAKQDLQQAVIQSPFSYLS